MSNVKDLLEKGGEGSGVRGHRSFHDNEKNHHYEEGLKIQEALSKISEAVKRRKAMNPHYKIPGEAQEIIKELRGRLAGHKAQLAGHVNQIGRIDKRAANSEEAVKRKFSKSVIAADNSSGVAIDTGAYAQASSGSDSKNWIEYFTNCMKGFDYGDTPRDITLDNGYFISLVKTDDGIYSGRVRQTIQPGQNAPLEENVFKVEKQTIPDIVQVLKAKEYIGLSVQPLVVEMAPEPQEPTVTLSEYLKIMEQRDLEDMRMKLDVIRTLINR